MSDPDDYRERLKREHEEEENRHKERLRQQLRAAGYPFAAAFGLIVAGFLLQSGLAASLLAGGVLMMIAAFTCIVMY